MAGHPTLGAATVTASRTHTSFLHECQLAPTTCPGATPRSPVWSDRESGLVRYSRKLVVVLPVIKALLQERHLHEYSVFAAEYRCVARDLELPRNAQAPGKSTNGEPFDPPAVTITG